MNHKRLLLEQLRRVNRYGHQATFMGLAYCINCRPHTHGRRFSLANNLRIQRAETPGRERKYLQFVDQSSGICTAFIPEWVYDDWDVDVRGQQYPVCFSCYSGDMGSPETYVRDKYYPEDLFWPSLCLVPRSNENC